MSRASRARRIAAAAAFGGGGLGALGAATFGLITAEVKLARRMIGQPFGLIGPDGSGVYGIGPGQPITLAMLGDSSAVGLGVDRADDTPGVLIAQEISALLGRPVRLQVLAVVGAESAALDPQVDHLLAQETRADVAVIMVGANDVTHRIRPSVAVRGLDAAVRRLREADIEVVVGTCPDLGTIEPIAHPLRWIARQWSRQLAAAQTIAVIEAGGRTVSLGDLLGPEFAARPREMFSADRFHPSAVGYARAAAALIPSVAGALGLPAEQAEAAPPELEREEKVEDIAHAAAEAVQIAGTQVTPIEVGGSARGPAGRWAMLRIPQGLPGLPSLLRRRSNGGSAAATVATTISMGEADG